MLNLSKTNWKRISLEDVCEIKIGRTPPRENKKCWGEGSTWVTIRDFHGNKFISTSNEEITDEGVKIANCKLVEEGTILFTFKLTIGKVAISGKSLYTNEAIAAFPIKDKKKLQTEFLFNAMQAIDYSMKVDKAVKGLTLNKEKMRTLKIPLPPFEVQTKIVELFKDIETLIEQLEKQKESLTLLQKKLVDGLLQKVPEFGNLLNTKNFTLSKLDEIAECDKKYPEHIMEVERFVGLENIEPENYYLQGFGLVSNGTTFTKRFSKGDILFGKRRAYLKKVAVADFDGICSNDILVIRAKQNKMLQGLLPFYISSDAFIQHAISTSAGSLSPRTKWKDLAILEVAVPDLKAQQKILEVFVQFQETLKQIKTQKQTLKNLKQKLLNEILG